MRASRTAPAGYTVAGTVVLEGNKRLKWVLTIASLVALVVAWFALVAVVTALRPELAGSGGTYREGGEALVFLGGLLVSLLVTPLVVLVVHEAVLPPTGVSLVIFGAVLNIAGSVGDLYICARLCTTPASAVVEDRLDGITWHLAPAH